MTSSNPNIRNIAIIAHVDHGKTTLVDAMLNQSGIFGSHEEHIAYRALASLKVENGIFLADLTIETSGGSQPIHINGLWKSAAREVQAAVQAAQSAGQR